MATMAGEGGGTKEGVRGLGARTESLSEVFEGVMEKVEREKNVSLESLAR